MKAKGAWGTAKWCRIGSIHVDAARELCAGCPGATQLDDDKAPGRVPAARGAIGRAGTSRRVLFLQMTQVPWPSWLNP